MDGFRKDVAALVRSNSMSDTSNEELDDKHIYRVQVGAFSSEVGAKDQLSVLKEKGYNGFVVKAAYNNKNVYRVQVGAFTDLVNAKSFQKTLVGKGFTGFVVQTTSDVNYSVKDPEQYNESTEYNNDAPKKSVFKIAKEVIAGQWGTGEARKIKLKASGYDANEVQAEVNKILMSNK